MGAVDVYVYRGGGCLFDGGIWLRKWKNEKLRKG